MTLQDRLTALAQAVGADIKGLTAVLPARESLTKTGHPVGYSTISPPDGRTGTITHRISSTEAGRFRMYRTSAQRLADAARLATVDPVGDHGCLLEVVWASPGGFDVISGTLVLADGESAWYTNWEPATAGTTPNISLSLIGID